MSLYAADNKRWSHLKRYLGITWDTLPAMAFNNLDRTVIPYPKEKEIARDVLFEWFDSVLKG